MDLALASITGSSFDPTLTLAGAITIAMAVTVGQILERLAGLEAL